MILKKLIYLIGTLFFLLGIKGCEEGGLNITRNVIGTGPVISSNLDLPAFTSIKNTGVANIIVGTGNPQAVVFKAQQNIKDVMTCEVINQELQIGIKKDVSVEDSEEIIFEITIPELNAVELLGVGDFDLSGAYQEELMINLSGVGNVNAFNLEAGTCNIISTGVNTCEVRVRNNLNVTISGVGIVYYKGDPVISSTITGVGSLIDTNK